MTNYEKIKGMSVEDMADFLNNMWTHLDELGEEPHVSLVIGTHEHCVHQSFGDLVQFLKTEVEDDKQ